MRAAVLAAVVAAGGAWAVAAEAAPDRVRQLIDRLGGGGFRDREAAARELDTLGETALDALRAAAASAEPETRRRAADLVERIAERLATARVLTPTTVEFDYKDRPLAEAVADLARRTGATINLHDQAPNKFRNRRVTAATPGPVPFWDAVELLCRKADVHQWDGLTPVPGLLSQHQGAQMMGQGGFGGQVIVNSGRSRPSGPGPNVVVLLDGPEASLPASHGTAVRVRALPSNTAFPATAVASDEVLLPLQVSPEPKLSWQSAVGVRVDRAVDETGRPLTTVAALPMVPAGEDEFVFINNGVLMQAPARRAGPIGVKVRRDRPAKRVAELAGVVTAQVRLPEALAALPAPLKAAGQSVRGNHGVTLGLKSISRGDSGDVTLSADVKVPLEIQMPQFGGAVAMNGVFAGQIVIRGQGAVQFGPGGAVVAGGQPLAAGATEYQGLSLEDATGRRFTAVKGVAEPSQFGPDGVTMRVSVTFRPAEKGQDPARLVYTAPRPTTIDVPFLVKDVPLP